MDISCEMELPFSESSSLTGTSFESTASDLPVKLLGSSDDHLLHGNSDKHLTAADFKLDLGPANDLVSASDFDQGISSESLLIPEESSEGYSISDAALEGGARPVATSANVVAINNINCVQSIPLVSTLSGLQAVQVIPFGYLISGSKPDTHLIPVQTSVNSVTQSTSAHIQPIHNAVVIGNVMMLKSLVGKQLTEGQGNNIKKLDSGSKKSVEMSEKSLSKNKSIKVNSNGEMSRKVAHKKNIVSTRIQQQRGKIQQKNTKVKIDGKTISLTFEVKNVGTKTLSPCIEENNLTSGTPVITAEKPVTPQLQILTDVKEASSNTRYVSLLNGRNNCVTLKKNENLNVTDFETVEHVESNINSLNESDNNMDIISDVAKETKKDISKGKCNDRTTELENEVLTLLAKASEERSRLEQERSKIAARRKKSGKPCGNMPTDEELFKCEICGLEFNRHGNFTRHKLIHDVRLKDRYKCPECDRKFLQRCDLKRHLLIHTNQEPYRCQECGKGYIRRSDLVVHMRFHKKERVFACPYCSDKKFCQSGDLNRHVRNVHLHSSTYKCSLCDRQFSRDSALLQHEYTCHASSLLQNSRKKSKSGQYSGAKVKKKTETA